MSWDGRKAMAPEQDILAHNREAWDKLAEDKNEWTLPVSPEVVAAARRGNWEIYLTESRLSHGPGSRK